jgi:hypothetical protein
MSEANPANHLDGIPISTRILEAAKSPLRWHISGMLLEGGIHVLHGEEECFKTTATLQMLEALNLGGPFLGMALPGGVRVGMAELEMTDLIFNHKLQEFSAARRDSRIAEILTIGKDLRREILSAKTAEKRIKPLQQWAEHNQVEVLGIDSAVKLFPPTSDTSSQTAASDVFSQLQNLGTAVWLIAHDRKAQSGQEKSRGNQEIAGSGRFAQDPDMILECVRPDHRSPEAIFRCGKMRVGFKSPDIRIFFDAKEHRLFPFHPFLHLLPATREELQAQAEASYGWGRSSTDQKIKSMEPVVQRQQVGHKAYFEVDPSKDPRDLLEPSTKFEGF